MTYKGRLAVETEAVFHEVVQVEADGSKRTTIAGLACFALASQVFVAFGHVHLSKFSDG